MESMLTTLWSRKINKKYFRYWPEYLMYAWTRLKILNTSIYSALLTRARLTKRLISHNLYYIYLHTAWVDGAASSPKGQWWWPQSVYPEFPLQYPKPIPAPCRGCLWFSLLFWTNTILLTWRYNNTINSEICCRIC